MTRVCEFCEAESSADYHPISVIVRLGNGEQIIKDFCDLVCLRKWIRVRLN